MASVPYASYSVEYDPDTQVPLLVPREHVAAVYRLLAEAMEAAARPRLSILPQPDPDDEEGVHVEGNGRWTPAMVQRLSDALVSPTLRTALDTIASGSPHVVSYATVLDATEVAPNRLRAELASLSKLTTRLFARRTWPMQARQGLAGGTSMGYRMPQPVADWWLDASAASAPAPGGRSADA